MTLMQLLITGAFICLIEDGVLSCVRKNVRKILIEEF